MLFSQAFQSLLCSSSWHTAGSQALWTISKLTILENYQIKIYIHLFHFRDTEHFKSYYFKCSNLSLYLSNLKLWKFCYKIQKKYNQIRQYYLQTWLTPSLFRDVYPDTIPRKNMEKLGISQTVHALTEKTCQDESVLEEKVSGACAVTCTGSESAAWEKSVGNG